MPDVDWSDPCAKAGALRKTYMALIQGEKESEFTYMANGVTNTVVYSRADIARLEREMQNAEADCKALQTGGRPRRRQAIQFG